MKKYGVNDHFHEGPVAALGGALLGGLIGGGGTMAGLLTMGGMIGMGLGAVGGTLLGNALKPPKMDFSQQQPQQPPESAIPQTPAAPTIPAAPATPSVTPVATEGAAPMGPATTIGQDIGSGPAPEPFTPGEAAPLTMEGVSKGELTKKRKGRMATILTTPKTRAGVADEGDDDAMELLGG